MKPAVINVQDPIGKTVGRRVLKDSWKYGMGLQKLANELGKASGLPGLCPKGVYRFKSHADADTWMTNMMVKRAIGPRN